MTRIGKVSAVVLLAAIIAVAAAPVSADEIAQSGRQIVSKWQDAIVTVQLVVKTTASYEGEQAPPQEDKVEANGLLIDPSGLVVTPLSEISPEESMADYLGGEAEKYQVTTEITEVKIRMGDSKEIPAAVMIRDKELDLAFIRPLAKMATNVLAVDLSKGSKPELLDPVIALSRQGVAVNRAVAASLDRIETIVEKPRFFAVPDQGLDMGSSIFALDGSFIGLTVMRQLSSAAGGSNWYSNSAQIIVTAADLAEAAKQAP